MVTNRAARILATNYSTIDIKNFRRDQTLIFRNIFGFNDQTDLSTKFSLKSDRDGTADAPKYLIDKPKSVFWGNSKEFIILQMDPATTIDHEYIFLSVGVTNATTTTYRSEELIYQYYDSNASSSLGVSLALAIVYMLFACCCWCGGMPQVYILIRIPQMLFMLTLLAAKPQAATYFSFLENFRHNLFSVIPNPVVIDEQNGNECQPPVQFFAEMLSCHVYNTLKNYVLAFLIFSVFYAFIVTNKFHDRDLFMRLRKVMDYHIFMLAIFPDVAIAIYLNAVAGLNNSVMSFGFLLSLLLIIWYAHIFNNILGAYFRKDRQQVVDFLRFFVFSRSNLTVADPKLGLKFLAVMLDFLKIFIKVTMIVLFFNAPKTQMVVVFLVYLLNVVFLVACRPYSNIFQNVFYAASDLAFFLIVVLAYAAHSAFDNTSMAAKENRYGGAQAALVIIVFLVNLFNFLIPALKGNDAQTVLHRPSEDVPVDTGKDKAKVKVEADRPHHVDIKEATPKDYLGKPKTLERDIHTAEARSNSRFTEGSELPLNREEQMPMKPKESENPAVNTGKRKVEIKGMAPGGLSKDHKESRPSEEILLRGDVIRSQEQLPPTSQNRDQPPTAHSSQVQPRKNNLISSQVVEHGQQPVSNSQIQSPARFDGTPQNEAGASQIGRSSELPPVKTGKVPIRKTFKPANVQNQDFEGM